MWSVHIAAQLHANGCFRPLDCEAAVLSHRMRGHRARVVPGHRVQDVPSSKGEI